MIQCWAIISTPAKRHLDGFSLEANSRLIEWYLDPQKRKNFVKVGPHLTKLSVLAHERLYEYGVKPKACNCPYGLNYQLSLQSIVI